MKIITRRIKPGSDLKTTIEEIVVQHAIKAGFIVTCVGGLNQATVRMAGATPESQDIRKFIGNFEIVSLVGTLSVDGLHLHISFSDKDGIVFGGHLKEGTIINPTAEIVIGIDKESEFAREMDDATGFKELVVRKEQ